LKKDRIQIKKMKLISLKSFFEQTKIEYINTKNVIAAEQGVPKQSRK